MILYVGNLPYNFTADDLRRVFVAFDHIKSVTVVSDRISGRSKGFGFVEITNKSEALAAIDYLHGRFVADRALMVMEAQPLHSGPADPTRPESSRAQKAKPGPRPTAPKPLAGAASKAKRSEGSGAGGAQRGGKMGVGGQAGKAGSGPGRGSKAAGGQGRAAKPPGGVGRVASKSNRPRREG